MDNLILLPLILACVVIVVMVLRSYIIWSLSAETHEKIDMLGEFDAWYWDECWIAAAELVGPNSHEYEAVFDRFYEDDARRAAARKYYAGGR